MSKQQKGGRLVYTSATCPTLAPLIFLSFGSQMLLPRSLSSSAVPCDAFSCFLSKHIGLLLIVVPFTLYNGSLASKDLQSQTVLMSHQTGFVVTNVVRARCSSVSKSRSMSLFIPESNLAARSRVEKGGFLAMSGFESGVPGGGVT